MSKTKCHPENNPMQNVYGLLRCEKCGNYYENPASKWRDEAREIALWLYPLDDLTEGVSRTLTDKISEALSRAYERGWNSAIEAAAKVAEETKFDRICQEHGHDDGDIRWSFNGCKEISDKLKELKKI